ncbi:hypothetical protein ACHAWO_003966 [Cyclotella atomus]|uniref:RED-like N-terminal domain-containing protein n=1 Tax=Cyclotella atomus TaxID=382360 RepID=A0ABD3NAJ6_9STRA
MNNEAFRSLVNAKRKSTKEIAREAVEQEFRKRKRNRDDQGYGSDDSDDSNGNDRKQRSRRQDEEAKKDDVDPSSSSTKRGKREKKPEYRDRARERREGKAVDYALLDVHVDLDTSHAAHDGPVTAEDRKRQAELSKYLGGDEEHTHLVKGLDRVLAEKVRREEMGQVQDYDFDEFVEEAFEKGNAAAAGDVGGGLHSVRPNSDLGRSVLGYLLQRQGRSDNNNKLAMSARVKANPALQKSIQRSILTFSLNSDTRRRKHVWDAPQLSVQAFTTDNVATLKATPLDRQLITTITNKLKGHLLRVKHGNVTFSKDVASNVNNEEASPDAEQKQNTTSVTAESKTRPAPESDSDDDIFENAGDYIPPTAEEAKTNAAESKSVNKETNTNANGDATKKKSSIFDNLITKPTPAATVQPRKLQIQLSQQHQSKNVINRDVIGAAASSSDDQPITKRRGPQTAAMEGYSMSNYSGGYGEDIDVDFGNFDEDDRRKQKKKETNGGDDDKNDNEEDEGNGF